MRVGYERLAELDEVLHRARQLAARTVIFDIEPLVAYWDSGQAALDRGVALVLSQIKTVPSVQVIVPPDPAPGVHPGAAAASVNPVGSVSVTVTTSAASGPWLVTVRA